MAEVVIERCLPSQRTAGIVGLFDRVGQPGFAAVLNRIYHGRERGGLQSWIAVLAGQVVLHISVSPLQFSDGSSSIAGGVLGDLMAEPAHRDFWTPVALVRRVVSDVRASQVPDFLLTSYVPAAEAVFRAAGFQPFANLMRYVFPLVWPYVFVRGLEHGERRPALEAVPFRDYPIATMARPPGSPGCLRPVSNSDYFATRMPRIQYPEGHWLIAGTREEPDALVLTSPKSKAELVVADVLWREPTAPLAGVLSSVARWAARQGYRRVTLTTLEGSRLAQAGQRAGFLLRHDPYPLMILQSTQSVALPPPREWSLTPFALSTW